MDFKEEEGGGGLNGSKFNQCQRGVKPQGAVSQVLLRKIFYFFQATRFYNLYHGF